MVIGAVSLNVVLFIIALIGCATSIHFRLKIKHTVDVAYHVEEDTGTSDDDEDGGNSHCCNCFFLIYFIILTFGCIFFLTVGIYGISYAGEIKTEQAKVDQFISEAQSAKSNLTEHAMQILDTLVINTATVQPTWWYDIQGLLDCCGYIDGLTPVQSDYDANQAKCAQASQSITSSGNGTSVTSNAAGCNDCKTTGMTKTECSSAENYEDCQRLLKGCPMYTGPACFNNQNSTSCFKLIYEPISNYGVYIGAGMLVTWFLLSIVEIAALSLCCMRCCGKSGKR